MELLELLENVNLIDTKDNVIPANTVIANNRYIVYLFSASWCSPCTDLLETLKQIQQESIEREVSLVIIYITQDTEEDKMMKHFHEKHGEWYAIPFGDAVIDELIFRFGVSYVPFIAVLRNDGIIITKNGRKEIEDNGVNVLTKWTN